MPAASSSSPSEESSNHFELIKLLCLSVQHVHGTAQSGVKGTNDPDDIEWILDIRDRRSDESLLNRTQLTFIIPGTSIPNRGCNDLVVVDLLILD